MTDERNLEAHLGEDDADRVSRRGLIGGLAASGLGLGLLQAASAPEAKAQVRAEGAFFALEVGGKSLGAFIELTGIGSETSGEGGSSAPAPGRSKYSNIVLKRGMSAQMDLWDWRKMIDDGGPTGKDLRKDGSVVLYDEAKTEIARWNFTNAWPSKLEAGHGKLQSDDVMILEEVHLVPESIRRVK